MDSYIVRRSDQLQADPSGRIVFGVVAPFGVGAECFDRLGPSRPYTETIARGAFSRSIKERGQKINLIYEHQHEQTMPIGRAVRLEERPDGLWGEFAISRTARGDEALQLVHEGILDGFSIRARVVRSHKDSRQAVTRQELALADVSLTGTPIYADAAVVGVRSRVSQLDSPLSAEMAARQLSYLLRVTKP